MLLDLSVPLSNILTTFTGAWVKLGSCADIWISSAAKGDDMIDSSKILHSSASHCKSQSSASTTNSADKSDGAGDSTTRHSGSFYQRHDFVFGLFGAVYMHRPRLRLDSGYCTKYRSFQANAYFHRGAHLIGVFTINRLKGLKTAHFNPF